jgi:acyl-homoserine-lactone acylase
MVSASYRLLVKRILSTLGVLAAFTGATAARGELPGDDLAKLVTIRRDTFGVPHILAETEEAAYLGQGYATAEDRVLVMARLYLQARGEEAAHFGEKFVENDFLVKQMRIHEGAQEGYAKLAPWVQRILDAYAAGFNRYVAKHRAELPEWVKPVTGVDLLAHGRRVVIMEFSMDLEQVREIGRKKAATPAQPAANGDALDLPGSNMWAIGRGRTASGKGILLANPHLAWRGSQLFYESHITVPGKVNILGSTLTGGPGITIGFNENLGWSHTVNLHDSDDIYELTIAPSRPDHYLYDGKPVPLRRDTLRVQVKTDTGMTEKTRDVAWSHFGPIVKVIGEKAYALKSANLDEFRFVEQWNRMGKARDLREFRAVLDMQALPMFNICYADKEGNVFYLFNGRFPDRPRGYDWAGIIPGHSSDAEWSRILPQHRLPQMLNPPGGYVQNCNSAPWYTSARLPINRRDYPDDLTPNINGMRQQLSLKLLETEGEVTLERVLRDKYNTRMLLADRVKPDLLQLAKGQTIDGVPLDEAVGVLESWDNTVSRESRGSVLFEKFWRKYGMRAAKPYAKPWDDTNPIDTPAGIGEAETARTALAAALKEVKERHGRLDVSWGDVHRLRRGDLDLAVGGLASEFRPFRGARMGDFGTFRIISYTDEKDGKAIARGGDSFVLAVEFTTPPTAYSILAYSQSEDPKSPHHTDQTKLFTEEKWKRAWFTEDDIQKNLKRKYQP